QYYLAVTPLVLTLRGGALLHPIRSAALRRWYFLSLLLALAVLLLVRFALLPLKPGEGGWRPTAGVMVDALAAAVVVSLCLGATYVVLFPKDPVLAMEVLESREIEPTLDSAARSARLW